MKNLFSLLGSKEDAAADERYQQAMVDADIEGMADDADYAALTRRMDEDGLSAEARLDRLRAFVAARQAASLKQG
jgi:hypothetical protein